ncbi:hypothetical protein F511_11297 [Dorcoceras hygrometricum]|uniref:Uncharacterized protein n=1 Tax=Dorcoceras hygrometricum TaxID=472368 RepID=A0A2Z7CNT1_9LAMI|nr:hypothetical protein F511_11297 [Dorcoceras hygrometricum]
MAAPPPRAHERARQRACRAKSALVAWPMAVFVCTSRAICRGLVLLRFARHCVSCRPLVVRGRSAAAIHEGGQAMLLMCARLVARRAEGGRWSAQERRLAAHRLAHDRCPASPMVVPPIGASRRDCAALVAREILRGGAAGRPPLRRCRDGWSDFF